MIKTLSETMPVARKAYHCDACDWIGNYINDGVTFTIADYRQIVKAKRNQWRIQPGQRYIKQFNTDGNDVWTFRAIPEIHDLCVKYDLYDDWI